MYLDFVEPLTEEKPAPDRRAWRSVLGNPPLAVELATFIIRARNAGEVRADVDPDLAGLLVATGYFAILTEWILAEPAPFDLTARLSQMVSILCAGLA